MGEGPGGRGGGYGYIPEPKLELSVRLGVRVPSERTCYECCAVLQAGSTSRNTGQGLLQVRLCLPLPVSWELTALTLAFSVRGGELILKSRMGWEVASTLPSGCQCRGGPALSQELCVAVGQCGWYCEIPAASQQIMGPGTVRPSQQVYVTEMIVFSSELRARG